MLHIALIMLSLGLTHSAASDVTDLPSYQRTSFLFDGASTRVMNILSRNATREHFEAIVNRCVANGDNTIYLYLSNQGDGEPHPTSFYRDDVFGGDVDLLQVAEMRYRLDYARRQGLAVVAWFFADDSGGISGASLETKKRYMREAVELFNNRIASYVIALEGDEHMRSSVAPLAVWLDGLTTKPIGNHQLSGKYDLSASIPQIDLHYHQYGFGKTAAQIRAATIEIIAAVGKPVIACEYSLNSDSPDAWLLGDAAIGAGAIGTGNGRTPVSTGVAASEPTPSHLTASPNPFNGATTVRLYISEPENVAVAVFDLTGRCVRKLYDGRLLSGTHMISWDGRDTLGRPVSSGVYICVAKGLKFRAKVRLVLIR
jgi:hypothetical protein